MAFAQIGDILVVAGFIAAICFFYRIKIRQDAPKGFCLFILRVVALSCLNWVTVGYRNRNAERGLRWGALATLPIPSGVTAWCCKCIRPPRRANDLEQPGRPESTASRTRGDVCLWPRASLQLRSVVWEHRRRWDSSNLVRPLWRSLGRWIRLWRSLCCGM